MKTPILLFALLATLTSYAIPPPVYLSKYNYGNTNSSIAKVIVTDASGNMYVAGGYQGTIDFDPSANTANFTFAGPVNYSDAYVAKYNSQGQYQWAISFGVASFSDNVAGMAVDASGNVYVTGTFGGTTDFDPSAGVANVTSNGSADIFVAKYNSAGQYQWAFNMGASVAGSESGSAIAVDASSNVYVTGNFYSASPGVDFDPSAGTAILSGNSTDAFLAKYNSLGQYQWAFAIGGSSSDYGYGLTLDAANNIILTGSISGTTAIDFNPSSSTTNNVTGLGGTDIFLAKYNSSGQYVWAFGIGSTSNDNGYSVKMDASGNIVLAGQFGGTATDFNPSATTSALTAVGGQDMFVAKYTSSGAYTWAIGAGSSSTDLANTVSIDAFDNILVSGSISGTTDFDPSASVQNVTGVGGLDGYVAKYNSSGQYQWAFGIASTGTDLCGSVCASTTSSTLYVAGHIGAAADFDPSTATASRTPPAAFELYTAQYFDEYIWTGSSSSTWATAGNWNLSAAPASTQRVYVPGADVTNMPVISTTGNSLKSLNVQPYATMTLTGSVSVSDSMTINGNLVSTGTVNGKLVNANTGYITTNVASIGTLTVNGSFLSRAGSNILFRLAGNGGAGVSNGNDNLAVNGTVTLGDTLTVSLSGSYTPAIGQSFTLVTATSISGTFANLKLPAGLSGTLSYSPTAVTFTTAAILPVKLVAFSAKQAAAGKQQCLLQWETSMEDNLIEYLIQRSSDGSHFSNTGSVKASNAGTYMFTDNSPVKGINYYRLKMVSGDSTMEYSKVVSVNLKEHQIVQVSPNPAKGRLNILTNSPANNTTFQVELINLSGNRVYKKTHSGNGAISLDISKFSNGIYIIKVGESVNQVIIDNR